MIRRFTSGHAVRLARSRVTRRALLGHSPSQRLRKAKTIIFVLYAFVTDQAIHRHACALAIQQGELGDDIGKGDSNGAGGQGSIQTCAHYAEDVRAPGTSAAAGDAPQARPRTISSTRRHDLPQFLIENLLPDKKIHRYSDESMFFSVENLI
ncbi:hypothetical protein EVAR_76823_1 [Eumeta japonica]|uniref:Uncharacterized protein n=1 Tax=Eumeta variegata TaxID=151549 RepID=A0A4C1Z831_EUMVA|nr:hypothetical protein EVAR_76823_1 [Eumeta japonica]